MKQLFLVLIASSLLMTACQPDPPPVNNQKTTAQKLMGKWKVEKLITDYYIPATVFDSRDTYVGLPHDSLVFKTNGEVYNYMDDPADPDILDYSIVNDSTIYIDGELTKLREFTDTKLMLYSEYIAPGANNKKEVYHVYLVR